MTRWSPEPRTGRGTKRGAPGLSLAHGRAQPTLGETVMGGKRGDAERILRARGWEGGQTPAGPAPGLPGAHAVAIDAGHHTQTPHSLQPTPSDAPSLLNTGSCSKPLTHFVLLGSPSLKLSPISLSIVLTPGPDPSAVTSPWTCRDQGTTWPHFCSSDGRTWDADYSPVLSPPSPTSHLLLLPTPPPPPSLGAADLASFSAEATQRERPQMPPPGLPPDQHLPDTRCHPPVTRRATRRGSSRRGSPSRPPVVRSLLQQIRTCGSIPTVRTAIS